jgi:hypothetical protein
VLAYKIVNWAEAPGRREAHLVITEEKREISRRNARARMKRIARALGEEDSPRIHRAIGNVARKLGFERVGQLVEEAKAIHAGSGMLVRNGSRKRTVGGIFFQLAGVLLESRASAAGAVHRDEGQEVGVLLR